MGLEDLARSTGVTAPASAPNVVAAIVSEDAAPPAPLRVIVPSFDDALVYEVDVYPGAPLKGAEVLIAFDEDGEPWAIAPGALQPPAGISDGQGIVWEDAGGGAFVPADVVVDGDSRLSDARTPTAHTHAKADLPASVAYEDEANVFASDITVRGQTWSDRPLGTDLAYASGATGDTFARWNVDASGKLKWGSGSAGADVNLWRNGVGYLATDAAFIAQGGYQTTAADYAVWLNHNTSKIYFGTSADVNLYRAGAGDLRTNAARLRLLDNWYGFSVTSNTLNYDTAQHHVFRTGTPGAEVERARISDNGSLVVNGRQLGAVGDIAEIPANTIPSGWLECNGDKVSRSTYAALWNVIGTRYGAGDESTTFNLPDLRPPMPWAFSHSSAAGWGTGGSWFTNPVSFLSDTGPASYWPGMGNWGAYFVTPGTYALEGITYALPIANGAKLMHGETYCFSGWIHNSNGSAGTQIIFGEASAYNTSLWASPSNTWYYFYGEWFATKEISVPYFVIRTNVQAVTTVYFRGLWVGPRYARQVIRT